jgi:hypothetical protein
VNITVRQFRSWNAVIYVVCTCLKLNGPASTFKLRTIFSSITAMVKESSSLNLPKSSFLHTACSYCESTVSSHKWLYYVYQNTTGELLLFAHRIIKGTCMNGATRIRTSLSHKIRNRVPRELPKMLNDIFK